jgi:hypothetical protein
MASKEGQQIDTLPVQAYGLDGTTLRKIAVDSTGKLITSGGGISIGATITSATEGSVLFAGASSVLAQDNASFNFNSTTKTLSLSTSSSSTYSLTAWPTTAARNDANFAVGFTFQVTNTITVNRLGRLYVAGNSQNHGIKLWQTSGQTQLASGTILAASTSDGNNYKWVSITPVTLTAGNTYAIAVDENASGDVWKDSWGPSFQQYFTSINNAFTSTQSAYPNNTNTANYSYSTPAMDFSYTATTSITGNSLIVNNVTAGTSFTTNQVTGSTSILTLSAPTTYFNGRLNIGAIGTAYTSNMLTFNTSTSNPVWLNLGANGAGDVFNLQRESSGLIKIMAGYASLAFCVGGSAASSATEKMRILSTGNVGIGTTTVSARLHAISTTEQLRLGYDASNYCSTTVSSTGGVTFDAVGSGAGFTFNDAVINTVPMRLKGYTVAGLPAGTAGDVAYVTDAVLPTFLATLTGGGSVVTPVFYNGTAWVSY